MAKETLEGLKVLVVDDEAAMRMVLEMRLKDWGCEVTTAEDGLAGIEAAKKTRPDVILSDVVMPHLNGLDLLRSVQALEPVPAVVLLTAQGTIDIAVTAMKEGASDFLTKPLDYVKVRAILEAAARDNALRQQSRRLASKLEHQPGFGDFVGSSRAMKEVYELLETLANNDASVLITGESGTGKELAARALHSLSLRSSGPFVAVNSSAIPETLMESELFGHEKGSFTGAAATRAGCFEMAHHGTLLLDEISEMPPLLQPKLLRVLEDRRVRRLGGSQEFQFDVRVLAATNRDPREAVRAGALREDLYYRLNVFTVHLPPLRERKEDIPQLLQHFIQELNAKHRTAVVTARPEALDLLRNYHWPGNVREFRNLIERAVILARGEWIEPAHLPAYVISAESVTAGKMMIASGSTAADMERELILKTLEQTGNNKAETARRLGLDVKTIRNKLKTYGL